MSEKFTFFWNGPFSQWAHSTFVVEGVTYNNCEQYMMAQKAKLFNDAETLNKILDTDDPKTIKALGRVVKNYNQATWDKNKVRIVTEGNYAKFSQNEDFKRQLISTIGTTLTEASPYDKIWGIGLSETDPRRLDRNQWQGENLLGQVLTTVRELLIIESQKDEKS